MDAFWAAPPITRTITAAVVLESVAVYGGLVGFQSVIFFYPLILKFPPQLWRLATSFLLTGPNLAMIFDPYMLFTYGKAIETSSPRFARRGDFFIYVAFVCGVILILDGLCLGAISFNDALILAFSHTFAQDNAGSSIGFFVFTIPAGLLPFAILAMTFVMAGTTATKQQATGLLAAHLYDFLTRIWPTYGGGINLVQTPFFVSKWFGDDATSVRARGPGTAYVPGVSRPAASMPSAGRSTALPANWTSRGAGRRLGGD